MTANITTYTGAWQARLLQFNIRRNVCPDKGKKGIWVPGEASFSLKDVAGTEDETSVAISMCVLGRMAGENGTKGWRGVFQTGQVNPFPKCPRQVKDPWYVHVVIYRDSIIRFGHEHLRGPSLCLLAQ